MPSPDLLPTGRSFPSATPPQLDDVLRQARRRRVRRAGVVGTSAVAALAAVALAFTPNGSTATLKVVDPAHPGRTATPAPPSPSATVGRGVPTAAPEGSAGPRPATRHLAPKAQASARAAATAAAPQESGTRAASPAAIVGPTHRMTTYAPTMACDGSGPTAATGWCSYYAGATSGAAGHAVTLATGVCRLPGRANGVLVSRTGRQADFSVGLRSYPSVWTWSHGHTFTSTSTSITVPAGTCVEWYVAWRIVDDGGHPLAPGSYSLDAAPRMQPTGSTSATASNPTTFTVR